MRKQLQELSGSGETFCAAHGQQEGYHGQNPIGGSTWWDMNFFKGILKAFPAPRRGTAHKLVWLWAKETTTQVGISIERYQKQSLPGTDFKGTKDTGLRMAVESSGVWNCWESLRVGNMKLGRQSFCWNGDSGHCRSQGCGLGQGEPQVFGNGACLSLNGQLYMLQVGRGRGQSPFDAQLVTL